MLVFDKEERGWGRGGDYESVLLVVVPLDEAVALRDDGLAVAALPLVLEEVGPLEELLLVELELPHPSRCKQPSRRRIRQPIRREGDLQLARSGEYLAV